jgi:hypothetical protein
LVELSKEIKMKFITLKEMQFKPDLIFTLLVMLTMLIFSMHSFAAQTDTNDTGSKTQAERFDHTTTGYPLTGSHATIADCGSCHVGGVFKGTPHNCNGCHAKGQRVVALAMSSNHLPSTQPCDICHTNTVTFLGARYNHGMANSGECGSCHNGSIATGRPASHFSDLIKRSNSCDKCHRPTVWLPSFWNHSGVSGNCASCHLDAARVRLENTQQQIAGTSPGHFAHLPANNSFGCESCHHTFTNWYGAIFNHVGAAGTCLGCHDGSRATGTAQFAGHTSIGSNDCSACHISTTTWLGALGAKPANHILYNNAGQNCADCHMGTTTVSGATLHGYVSSTCKTCHDNSSPVYAWTKSPPDRRTLGNHERSTTSQDCISCHTRVFTRWNSP